MLILVAVMALMLFALTALAVDGSRVYATASTVQATADAASLVLSRAVMVDSGAGIELRNGTTATIAEATFARNARSAIDAGGLSRLTASKIAVYDSSHVCVAVGGGTFTRWHDVVLSGCHNDGLLIHEPNADVAIWDPELTRTRRDEDILSNGRFSIFAGWEITGWPIVTIRRGQVVYENGKIVAPPGSGRLAPRTRWQRP